MGKEELNRRCAVAMRACEDDWQLVLPVELHHNLANVVRSIVEHQNGVFSPPLLLLIHHSNEVAEVHLHHLLVRVGLQQRYMHLSFTIKRSYHRDSRLHLLLGY